MIPIEGKNLYDGLRYRVDVTVSGTYPINGDDYLLDKDALRTNVDVMNIVLSTNYLKRVKTGDTLDVAVHVHEFNPAEAALIEVERVTQQSKLAQADLSKALTAIKYLELQVTNRAGFKKYKYKEALTNDLSALTRALIAYSTNIAMVGKDSSGKQDQEGSNNRRDSLEQFQAGIQEPLRNLKAIFLLMSGETSAADGFQSRRSVSTASRTFTFYYFKKYRDEYHAKRVLPSNLMAFPEPEDEAIKLFGKRIADHYFVVRLSVRNTETEDRLISSGMIRAKGRAIVDSANISGDEKFTVPVEVSPHSLQQVYAVLTDTSHKTLRSFTFRTLELAGTVASAYTLTFGAVETTKDAIQLATGIGVPAFGKFWTDRQPGYQRNLVNFGMEDLVKVPKGGVTAHKFLFFPKDAIEGMIIDFHSYGNLVRVDSIFEGESFSRKSRKFKQPDARVAYLIFDNLEIPFENVFQAEPSDPRQRVFELKLGVEDQLQRRLDVQSNWVGKSGSAPFLDIVSYDQLTTNKDTSAASIITSLGTRWNDLEVRSPVAEISVEQITNALATVGALIQLIDPASMKSDANFFGSVESLRKANLDLEDIRRELLSGRPLGSLVDRVNEIERMVHDSRVVMNFYIGAARLLADQKLFQDLAKSLVPGDQKDVNRKEFQEAFTKLKNLLTSLGELRGKDFQVKLLPNAKF